MKLSHPPSTSVVNTSLERDVKTFSLNSMDALQILQRQLSSLGLSFCFVANDDDVLLLASLLPENLNRIIPRRLKLIYHDAV